MKSVKDSLLSSQLIEFSQSLHINSLLNFHYFTIICLIHSFILILFYPPGIFFSQFYNLLFSVCISLI